MGQRWAYDSGTPRENAFNPLATTAAKIKYPSLREGSIELLPGQYFDKETNLAYNYFRDYDPAIGRYVQSDPIGLDGGLNTYGYANQNPLSYVDPTGEVFFLLAGAFLGGSSTTTTLAALGLTGVVGAAIYASTQNAAPAPSRGGLSDFGVDSSPARSGSQAATGGGSCEPPEDDCRRSKEALQRLYDRLNGIPLSPDDLTGPRRFQILQQRRQFNELAEDYNQKCARVTGPFAARLKVGPQRPSLSGGRLLHDFYGR